MNKYILIKNRLNKMWSHVGELLSLIMSSDYSLEYKKGYFAAIAEWYKDIDAFDMYLKNEYNK